jgi:hypothetical protein
LASLPACTALTGATEKSVAAAEANAIEVNFLLVTMNLSFDISDILNK